MMLSFCLIAFSEARSRFLVFWEPCECPQFRMLLSDKTAPGLSDSHSSNQESELTKTHSRPFLDTIATNWPRE